MQLYKIFFVLFFTSVLSLTPYSLLLQNSGTTWKLQECGYEITNNLSTYTSQYFSVSTGSVHFATDSNCPSTSNGAGPRTELRQLTPWTLKSGPHVMSGVVRVEQIDGMTRKKVTFAQVFCQDVNAPILELGYNSGQLFSLMRTSTTQGNMVSKSFSSIALNEDVTYAITISTSGNMQVSVGGSVIISETLQSDAFSKLFYFKAGCYVQAQNDATSTYQVSVAYSQLKVGNTAAFATVDSNEKVSDTFSTSTIGMLCFGVAIGIVLGLVVAGIVTYKTQPKLDGI